MQKSLRKIKTQKIFFVKFFFAGQRFVPFFEKDLPQGPASPLAPDPVLL